MCNCPKYIKEYLGYTGSKEKNQKNNFLIALIESILNYQEMLTTNRIELYLLFKDYPELLHNFYFNAPLLREYLKLISFRKKEFILGNDLSIKYYIREFPSKFYI
jgi:hypothetical protein